MSGTLQSILYIEDDLHMRTSAKLVLEVIGKFHVRECASGREALLAARDFQPDLILIDVLTAEFDGTDTLALLRRLPHLEHTPALFISSLPAPGDFARYIEAGAIGVIPKPMMPLRLSGQINTLWEQCGH